MNDLFEQLKAEPPINKYISEAPPPTPAKRLSLDKPTKTDKPIRDAPPPTPPKRLSQDKPTKTDQNIRKAPTPAPPKRLSQDKPTKSDKYIREDPAPTPPKRLSLDKPPKSDKYASEAPPPMPPKRLSLDKPIKSDKNVKLAKADKYEKSPAKSDKVVGSPTKSDKHERSLSKSDKFERSPKKSDKHEGSPIKSDKHERSSIMTDKHEKSPVKGDKHEKSSKPDKNHDKSNVNLEKSHKKSDQHEKTSSTSPKKSDNHDKSVKFNKHEESPKKVDKHHEKTPKKVESLPKFAKKIDSKNEKPAKKSHKQSLGLDVAASIRSTSCSSPRRDSMPPPRSAVVFKKPTHKSRSMSPPKLLIASGTIKPFKVLIERKKLEDLMAQHARAAQRAKKTSSLSSPLSKGPKTNKFTLPPKRRISTFVETAKTSDSKRDKSPVRPLISSNTTTAPKKLTTPTKAQQKLFDPAVLKQVQKLKTLSVKRCMVRLQRSNFSELQKKLEKPVIATKPMSSPHKTGEKRKNTTPNSSLSPASPSKKARLSKDAKPQSGFFIKLTSSPSSSRSKLLGKGDLHKKSSANKEKVKPAKKSDHSKTTFKATKFSRTTLIKNFGKKFFRSRVKIERCNHPLMMIFESNARARKLQAKGNKSKNLSVSFKEQVEIFGDSNSDSDSSDDDSDPDFSIGGASTSKAAKSKALAAAAAAASTPQPMPARLKKVENGKVIDDIEFDPSLFIDPRDAKSSTPFNSIGRRRKLEKKSYSPLKGDDTPSPRKEHLKLANERLPPSGLRRLNIDDADDEDDEDDDCEYIVPIDIPQRRGSRVNSTNVPQDMPALAATNGTNESPIPVNESDTSGSFASAQDQIRPLTNSDKTNSDKTNSDKTNSDKTNSDETNSNCLPILKRISPAPSISSLRDIVDSVISSSNEPEKATATSNEPEKATTTSNDHGSETNKNFGVALDTEMTLELSDEEESENMTASNIVDSFVKETIDDLSKDIEMNETSAANNVSRDLVSKLYVAE